MKLPNKAIAQSLIIFASGISSASVASVVTSALGVQSAPIIGIVVGFFVAVLFGLIGGAASEAYNENELKP